MTPTASNPLLKLQYEPALENLGDDYYDPVAAAEFPQHQLRFRNDQLLPLLGLHPQSVTDVREVLAGEALHHLGVKTSRCLSLVETGEALWRGDEPSPTRASVMIRCSLSHIRFGTFERLYYFQRPDLVKKLLDHVIDYYYPEIADSGEYEHRSGFVFSTQDRGD